MKRSQRMNKGSQRSSAIRQRNSMRQFYEFQRSVAKNNRARKNGQKRSSNKYSSDNSFTKILEGLWKIISKILKRF